MTRQTITFDSHGTPCDAWFYRGIDPSPFDGPAGRPVVVMAHGFAGTKDSGLEPFADRFADAGLAVLAFDFRGFGLSGGEPRQRISLSGQLDDYRSAITAASCQPGVDPTRVVVWGVSMSAGFAMTVAADHDDVCAVIAAIPLVSGPAAGRLAYHEVGAAAMVSSTMTGIGSALGARFGRAPTMLPVVGRPGEHAALTAEGFYESYLSIAGPSWRNEVDAAVGLELGRMRADKYASRITAPTLVQIADFDSAAPPHSAAKAAFAAHAEVRHYPCDHFDIFAGHDWFEPAVDHQLSFLARHLSPARRQTVEKAAR